MKDLTNDFEIWQQALKKIDLNESALPIYHGRILRENAKEYQKMQKILNCPEMVKCHKYILDRDPESLDEDDCTKINNLYKLGVDRGFIEDTVDVPDEDLPDSDFTKDEVCANDSAKPYCKPNYNAKVPCFTVLYSAMKDGQVKTGESYSNAVNPRAAKADVYAKLSKIGYDNISILAIECGDPDMAGTDDVYTAEDDILQNSCNAMYEEDDEKAAEKAPEKNDAGKQEVTQDAPAEKPAEEKPAEKPAEEKPAEEPKEQQDDTQQQAPDMTANEQPAEEKPAEEQSAEEKAEPAQAEDNAAEQKTDNAAEEQPKENAEQTASQEETNKDDSQQADQETAKKELDDNQKAALKDDYRKTFKNIMIKCEFMNKSFDDLTIAEKVKFFTEMAANWTKNEPNEFMTDKEIEQLNKIIIEN